MPHAREVRGRRRSPRVNAPVRRQQRAGSIPDIVLTLAFAAMTMAAAIFAGSYAGDHITTGEAGATLARLFAGSLGLVAFMAGLLGLALLRESRYIGARIVFAGFLGFLIGLVETLLFLDEPGPLLAVPPFFALLAIRQPREWFLRGLGLMPRGDGLR